MNSIWNLFAAPPLGQVLALPNLIEWLEHQPSWEPYQFDNPYDCACAKYLKDQGYTEAHVTTYSYCVRHSGEGKAVSGPLPTGWNEIFEGPEQRTYGAALKRARKLRDGN